MYAGTVIMTNKDLLYGVSLACWVVCQCHSDFFFLSVCPKNRKTEGFVPFQLVPNPTFLQLTTSGQISVRLCPAYRLMSRYDV